ncbi:nucleotidyltransferase family protein [Alphaproteobacteria bacterium LSUCC0226]
MKALLLAAGYGTRLGAITKCCPKCMVRVGNETILDHWLYKLDRLGVTEFIINTHYLAEQVEEYISRHPLRDKIVLCYEPILLGTAQTVLSHIDVLRRSTCFIVHVDNFCDDNLFNFVLAHESRPIGTVMSMLTFNTSTPEQCGIVEVDDMNILIDFYEKQKSPPSNKANGAVYIVSGGFFDLLERLHIVNNDFSNGIIPNLLGKVFCNHTDQYYEDIGTPESLKRANEFHLGKIK